MALFYPLCRIPKVSGKSACINGLTFSCLRLASSADVNARALNGRTPLMKLVAAIRLARIMIIQPTGQDNWGNNYTVLKWGKTQNNIVAETVGH